MWQILKMKIKFGIANEKTTASTARLKLPYFFKGITHLLEMCNLYQVLSEEGKILPRKLEYITLYVN